MKQISKILIGLIVLIILISTSTSIEKKSEYQKSTTKYSKINLIDSTIIKNFKYPVTHYFKKDRGVYRTDVDRFSTWQSVRDKNNQPFLTFSCNRSVILLAEDAVIYPLYYNDDGVPTKATVFYKDTIPNYVFELYRQPVEKKKRFWNKLKFWKKWKRKEK